MNKLTTANTNEYIDSREAAEMIERRHDNLVRDIERYIAIINQNPSDSQTSDLRSDNFFVKSSYTSGTGKDYKRYLLTKKGCEFVANKLTGDKGILFTARYIERFHELEEANKQPVLPQTYKQALQQLLMQVEANEQLAAHNEQLTTHNRELTMKAEQLETNLKEESAFKEEIFNITDGLLCLSEVARILKVPMRKFFSLLRSKRMLTQDNVATQEGIKRGYVVVKERVFHEKVRQQTYCTQKGLDYFRKFAKKYEDYLM